MNTYMLTLYRDDGGEATSLFGTLDTVMEKMCSSAFAKECLRNGFTFWELRQFLPFRQE